MLDSRMVLACRVCIVHVFCVFAVHFMLYLTALRYIIAIFIGASLRLDEVGFGRSDLGYTTYCRSLDDFKQIR